MAELADFGNTASANTFLFEEPNVAAGTINDKCREVMAAVRRQHEQADWIDLGYSPTYATSTTFTVTGDKTAVFVANLSLRLIGSGAMGTAYANVTSSSFGAGNTTVTVSFYSGSMDNTLNKVAHHVVKPTHLNYNALRNTPTMYAPPAGIVVDYAGSSAPSGWLMCFGQAVSRTTYADLFAAIGTTYGVGDNSTTFNLPDARGRVLAGKDDMGGSAASRLTSGTSGINGATLGAAGGDERMHQHTHAVTDGGHSHTVPRAAAGYSAGGGAQPANATDSGGGTVSTSSSTTGISIGNAGGGSSQNVQPTLIMNKIIKT